MKLNNHVVKMFEEHQHLFGTKIALNNILWLVSSDIFYDLGVKRVRTTYERKRTRKTNKKHS